MISRAPRFLKTVADRSPLSLLLLTAWIVSSLSLGLPASAWAADSKPKQAKTDAGEKTKDKPASKKAKAGAKAKKATEKKTTEKKASKKKQSNAGGCACPPPSGRPGEVISTTVFLSGGFRHDTGRLYEKAEVGGGGPEPTNQDIKAFGPMIQFGFIKKLGKHIGVGAAFGYGMNYTVSDRLTKEERENDQEPERYEMGQLLMLDARLEWSQHVSQPLAIVVTPVVGITTVLAGGYLREQINEVKDSHYISPRLGFVAGGEMGMRYFFNEWFSLRGVVGYNYMLQGLLHAKRRGEQADSKRVMRVSGSRLTGTLALEASF